jgi:hypothetical protein
VARPMLKLLFGPADYLVTKNALPPGNQNALPPGNQKRPPAWQPKKASRHNFKGNSDNEKKRGTIQKNMTVAYAISIASMLRSSHSGRVLGKQPRGHRPRVQHPATHAVTHRQRHSLAATSSFGSPPSPTSRLATTAPTPISVASRGC